QRNCCLARLAVADDQFALPASNRDHRIDGLQTGGHRLAHRLAIDNAWRDALEWNELVSCNRPLVIDRLAKGVHDAADHLVAHRNAHDASSSLYLFAFLDFGVVTEQHHADLVFFQVHGDTGEAVRKRKKFAGHDLVEAVHARDTIAESDNSSNFIDRDFRFIVLDLLPYQLRNFVCFELSHS